VITLPLGVLQTRVVRFTPELPAEKQAAIKNLEMGHVLRIVLTFRERFWEALTNLDEEGSPVKFADAAFIHADGLAFPTWWTQLPVRAPVLVGWVGGPDADRITASRNDASTRMKLADVTLAGDAGTPLGSFVSEQAIASLAQIFKLSTGYLLDQLVAVYFHDWQLNQFSRGAYAYVPVGGLDDQGVLAQPVDGVLFFAGEATTLGHIGTVHGAIMSGQRAAREILATFRDKTIRRQTQSD
jgi:monoamine oxidase